MGCPAGVEARDSARASTILGPTGPSEWNPCDVPSDIRSLVEFAGYLIVRTISEIYLHLIVISVSVWWKEGPIRCWRRWHAEALS